MSSWLPSWLPSLPTLSFPTSIQSHFISFVLKKSLGHFVKPGQLDVNQIDAQIGSGYVQINDIAFNVQAIDELLIGLPIELEDGKVSSVTARIPWPNPLTSTIGVSLHSPHLTFRLVPVSQQPTSFDRDLSESVFSVAESFIDELTPREEASLRESFHPDLPPASHNSEEEDEHIIPGGLDPFIGTPDEEDSSAEIDPPGVTVFATLIERLLARFTFDATDVKVTLVHPDQASVTLALGSISYRTDAPSSETSEGGEVRSLTVSDVDVSHTALSRTSSLSSSAGSQPTTTRSSSPASSSSSMDADAQFAMSQSLAFLPPRPISPSSSVGNSMYQSASENMASGFHSSSTSEQEQEHSLPAGVSPQIFLSFGSTPIVIRLITPPLHARASDLSRPPKVDVSLGVLSVALESYHVTSLVNMAAAWVTYAPSTQPSRAQEPPSQSALSIDVSGSLRGLVCILVPPSALQSAVEDRNLDTFFAHPLIPPRLNRAYARIHGEHLVMSASIRPPSKSSQSSSISAQVCLNDVSVFLFGPEGDSTELLASPLLITDPHMPSHSDSTHLYPSGDNMFISSLEIPSFDVVDWTNLSHRTPKVSAWRTRSKHPRREPATETTESPPCLKVQISSSRSSMTKDPEISIQVDSTPLHLFINLRRLGEEPWTSFLDGLPQAPSSPHSSQLDSTPPGTPRAHAHIPYAENERQRLEQLVIDDLNLDMEYNIGGYKDSARKSPARQHHSRKAHSSSSFRFNIPMVRVEVKPPPPPSSAARSGIVVLDLHDVQLASKSPEPARIRFASSLDVVNEEAVTLYASLQKLMISHVALGTPTTASPVLSIGSLSDNADEIRVSRSLPPLRPKIAIQQVQSGGRGHPTLILSIPSVYVVLNKAVLDGLQYWADDLAQFLDGPPTSVQKAYPPHGGESERSILGSKFFSKSRSDSGHGSGVTAREEELRTPLVKVTVTEGFVRLKLPSASQRGASRFFDVSAADIEVDLERKAIGKDETSIRLAITDIIVNDQQEGSPLLSLTSPRNMTSSPKSLLNFRFTSSTLPQTLNKESRISVTLWGSTLSVPQDSSWAEDLGHFAKAPPGAFESVIPSERTAISVCVSDCSVVLQAPHHPGAMVLHLGNLTFQTNLVGDTKDSAFTLSTPLPTTAIPFPGLSLLLINDRATSKMKISTSGFRSHAPDSVRQTTALPVSPVNPTIKMWKNKGYALLTELKELRLNFRRDITRQAGIFLTVERVDVQLHLCADTLGALSSLIQDIVSTTLPPADSSELPPEHGPTIIQKNLAATQLLSSIEDLAFKQVPELGPAPDMIHDDLPSNVDYLDESFGAAAGLRELLDEDLEDFDDQLSSSAAEDLGFISKVGGETIRMLHPEGLNIVENYFNTLVPDTTNEETSEPTALQLYVRHSDVKVFLYDGYDWVSTRTTIEEEFREMRKRLARIKQLVSTGQAPEGDLEDTSTLLFNSVYIGLDQDVDALEPTALIDAIDAELKYDLETASQSSWQSLHPPPSNSNVTQGHPVKLHRKRLTRSKVPNIELRLNGLTLRQDQYLPDATVASRTFATVRDVEILDHMPASSWNMFLTGMRSDSRGNVRETDSDMVKVELRNMRPFQGHALQEARLKAKILPLRLHVDQDALDFLKQFFNFKDPGEVLPPTSGASQDTYIQHAEIFPIDLKLDYKPRRVDYRALKEGRSIELMNFFHFDEAEMTLRHITLSGVTGWPRLFDLLNDLWTPDVKATQLVEVISGVAPIRSVVNVGSGIADLVLLPIAQYKKDGRIVRGVQKGASAFVKSTAIEAIKLGARLATGTQVILEQAEGLLGNQFNEPITAEAVHFQLPEGDDLFDVEDEVGGVISKYAEQPSDIQEGVQTVYKSLRRNLNSAAQTILAVPMEVYERSGNEGPVRSVIRAVPIAVLKPMIGATEAISKTLLGLHNTLDPDIRHDNDAKYKHRGHT